MGLNKHVDFSTAKLLKEKGFDELCDTYNDGISNVTLYPKYKNSTIPQFLYQYALVCVPTIDEVKWWLYENHGIWIEVFQNYGFLTFSTMLKKDGDVLNNILKEFNSPTEAYIEAINYCLTKLI